MNRYICIHCHFYQPPRENPWLEEIEAQDSAYPYHDWNSRITSECYAPMTTSRILGEHGKVIDIVNLYSKISFNFGPTLLSWMQKHKPYIYQAILDADKKSQKNFEGHGSAIAQVYNHIIMPLANSRDKWTQIYWGIRDFEHRFKRKPEGMWLAETAVDLETLDFLSQQGIAFTILAPRQAHRVRKIDEKRWKLVKDSKIDPKMPYLCKLPSGRSIVIFFYDGPISQVVAFSGLLNSGEEFANRLLSAFGQDNIQPQFVHIATDGETYGHHHRHGDMAIAYCMHYLESHNLAKITVYGQYLAQHPPAHEVEIFENSSWSCVHGIERWRNNCGCNSGMHQEWHQEWRAPLRAALDWLRDNLIHVYEEHSVELINDPWQARNMYINVMLNRSEENIKRFIKEHAKKELSEDEKIKLVKLLEMQRYAMLMYTSCGWFFDEISGIETVQIIQYASRAIQLAEQASGISIEDAFVNLLQRAPSNIHHYEHGTKIYQSFVQPAVVDLFRVGSHYAVVSLFKYDSPDSGSMYSYTVARKRYYQYALGEHKLAIGTVSVASDITLDKTIIDFCVLYIGGLNIVGRIHPSQEEEAFSKMHQEIHERFMKNQIHEVIKAMESHLPSHDYSLWHMFREKQREIVTQIFKKSSQEIEGLFRQAYERCYPFLQAIEAINIAVPHELRSITEFILNKEIRRILEEDNINFETLEKLVEQSCRQHLQLDKTTFGFIAEERITKFVQEWAESPEDQFRLEGIIRLFMALEELGLDLNLWQAQNTYFSTGKSLMAVIAGKSEGDEGAKRLSELFIKLGDYLKVKIA
jgi:alpha-amylase/alpha-mannosidase (GH57 family)/uncharacterized protein (UPF0216 family)